MQDYEKALKYYEKALTEVQKHFGENMSYAVLCENCAAVCERLGNREKQGYYIEKAKEVQAKL